MNIQNIITNIKNTIINSWFFLILLFPFFFLAKKLIKIDFIRDFCVNISIYFYFIFFVIFIVLEYIIFFKLFYNLKNKISSKSKNFLFFFVISFFIFLFSFFLINPSFKRPSSGQPPIYCGDEFNQIYEKVLKDNNIKYFLTEKYKINLEYDGDKLDLFKYKCKTKDGNIWNAIFDEDQSQNFVSSFFHIFLRVVQLDDFAQNLSQNVFFYNNVYKNIFIQKHTQKIIELNRNELKTQELKENLSLENLSQENLFPFVINKNNCNATNGTKNDCQLLEVSSDGNKYVVVNNLKRDINLIKEFINQKSPVGNDIYSAIKIEGSYEKNVYLKVYFTEGEGDNLLLKYNTDKKIAEKIEVPFDIKNYWERGEWVNELGNCIILGIHKTIPIIGVIKNNEVWTYNIETKDFSKYIINNANNCSYYNTKSVSWDEIDLALLIDGVKVRLIK